MSFALTTEQLESFQRAGLVLVRGLNGCSNKRGQN